MADDSDEEILRYDIMVERALRAVVRDALKVAVDTGLPGDHHFYITFRTDHPSVEISEALHSRYPEEMTVVVQHQFWDLAVADDYFAITLSFNGRPERLVVPFEAVSAFADPAVRFGLQFEALFSSSDEDERDDIKSANDLDGPAPEGLTELNTGAKGSDAAASTAKTAKAPSKKSASNPKSAEEADQEPGEGDNVVTLDSFRKNK